MFGRLWLGSTRATAADALVSDTCPALFKASLQFCDRVPIHLKQQCDSDSAPEAVPFKGSRLTATSNRTRFLLTILGPVALSMLAMLIVAQAVLYVEDSESTETIAEAVVVGQRLSRRQEGSLQTRR